VRLDDRTRAEASLAQAHELSLTDAERAQLAGEIAHAQELVRDM
jgi:hypothetical protein